MYGFIDNLYLNKELYSTLFIPICAKYKITMTEMLVLLFLSANTKSDTASDIVEKLKIAKSHVSASVRDLEERGYLEGKYLGHNHRFITPSVGNAYVIIRVEDNDKAAEILKGAGIELIEQDDIFKK